MSDPDLSLPRGVPATASEGPPVFSNCKMRLKLFRSCGEFGSAVDGLKQTFASLLQLHGGVIVA
ncbi:MAG: hypothetical protein ABI190_03855, partial [Casimicrobiaceae bacterium]